MAHPFRRGVQDESSDTESDEDYIPPEHVEVEDDESDSAGADLEPSSGGDTDLDIGKRKRKRKVRGRSSNTKKKPRTDDTSDNNDETTSNETLLSLPLKPSSVNVISSRTSSKSKSGDQDSSTPSPGYPDGFTTTGHSSEPSSSRSSRSSSSVGKSGVQASTSRISAILHPHSRSVTEGDKSTTASSPQLPSASKTGLGSMLAKLSKKKPTTLEKSQMGWQQFKSTNKTIEEDLAQNKNSKGNFLDRMDFLDRCS